MPTVIPVEIIQPRRDMWGPSLITGILGILTPLGAYFLGKLSELSKGRKEFRNNIDVLNGVIQDLQGDLNSIKRHLERRVNPTINDNSLIPTAIIPNKSTGMISALNRNEIIKSFSSNDNNIKKTKNTLYLLKTMDEVIQEIKGSIEEYNFALKNRLSIGNREYKKTKDKILGELDIVNNVTIKQMLNSKIFE